MEQVERVDGKVFIIIREGSFGEISGTSSANFLNDMFQITKGAL